MNPDQETVPLEHSVLLNGLILEKILPLLPFRQFLSSRLVCRIWDDAVRRRIPTRARLDISLCTMVKKGEDKKKSEVEEKLDAMEYLKITELQLGVEDNLNPVIATAFQEVGSLIRKLTIKMELAKDEDFHDFGILLGNCPNLRELIWWGGVHERFCHRHENMVFTSVTELSLGFYPGELPQTMGERAVLWISAMFPSTQSFTCLPHHREGIVRILLSAWGRGSKAFPLLQEGTLHLVVQEESRLAPLEGMPQGLKILNVTLNGKRETGSVQEFLEEDAIILGNILGRQGLERVVINFLNLWKPKPLLVVVGFPGSNNLKGFTVTSDFAGDLAIDFKPLPGAVFPKLVILTLPYLCLKGIQRLFTSIRADEWECPRLRRLGLKLRKEGVQELEGVVRDKFPQGELVDLAK